MRRNNRVIYPHPEWMCKTMSFIPTQSGLINVMQHSNLSPPRVDVNQQHTSEGSSFPPRVMWGSISYAVKAPDIPPIKTEDLERTTLGPTQAGGSEAENNMCMCVL
jgi:hypothetical protein